MLMNVLSSHIYNRMAKFIKETSVEFQNMLCEHKKKRKNRRTGILSESSFGEL